MTENLDDRGLRLIVRQYDLLFIDLWGVIHNGVTLFDDSIQVLEELEKINKNYVLLTNAPRPSSNVKTFLIKMGLDKKKTDRVYTSGEAALQHLNKKYFDKKFFHVGPPRDFDLFKLFKKNQVKDILDSEFLLCTGLFENYEDDLDYYKNLFKKSINKKMICTNPDLIVDKGNKREYCAGTIAKIFEKLGGTVDYFGKPYPLVYKQSFNLENLKILCIGDNLNTDIRGANMQNFSSLLILNGIHKEELSNESKENVFKKYKVNVDYTQSKLKW